MNYLQKQVDLARTLFQINVNTTQEIFKQQQESVKKYFELNSEFGGKLPTVDGFSTLVELQRAYGEAVWNNVRESGETQVSIVRSAVEEAGQAVRSTFTSVVEAGEEAAGVA